MCPAPDLGFVSHSDVPNSPGIAIRILGEVTPERVAIARAADHIFISEIKAAGVYDEMSQAYVAISQDRGMFFAGWFR